MQAGHLRAICSELDVQFCLETTKRPLADQGDLHGIPKRPNVVQGRSTATQNEFKVGPGTGKGRRKTRKGEQQITNLYTHTQNIRKLPIHLHTAAG